MRLIRTSLILSLIISLPAFGAPALAVEQINGAKTDPGENLAVKSYRDATYPLEPSDELFQMQRQWGLCNIGQAVGHQHGDGKEEIAPALMYGTADADIDAPEAWAKTTGDKKIVIAVLDSGIDQDHEDLRGKIVLNANFSPTPGSGHDDNIGHGTNIAGVIAATTNNGIGIAGIGRDCRLMNVKVFDDRGNSSTDLIAKGIRYATDHGAKVISMSFGVSDPNRNLLNAIRYAWEHNVVLVASAGNEGTSQVNYPAGYNDYVIAVAATDWDDNKAGMSNYGSWVDIAAPGMGIYATYPNHKTSHGKITHPARHYGFTSGTSIAAPHVAGVVGLVLSTPVGSWDKNGDRAWNPTEVKAKLLARSDTSNDSNKLIGIYSSYKIKRVNAFKAVSP